MVIVCTTVVVPDSRLPPDTLPVQPCALCIPRPLQGLLSLLHISRVSLACVSDAIPSHISYFSLSSYSVLSSASRSVVQEGQGRRCVLACDVTTWTWCGSLVGLSAPLYLCDVLFIVQIELRDVKIKISSRQRKKKRRNKTT
jgi:hypothetical protein